MSTATPPMVGAGPSIKQQFIDTYTREAATTRRVLNAYPADQCEFQPHARSKTARDLAWTFAVEQGVTNAALTGRFTLPPPPFPPTPETWDEVIAAFSGGQQQVLQTLEGMTDDQLVETVQFFAGPGQFGPIPKIELCWFMLMDQVHHRGQLSVYLRMAGGKVPSIYGPSADEPW